MYLFTKELLTFVFMFMGLFPKCISVHHVYAWCFQRPGDGPMFYKTRVTSSHEVLCGF